MDTITQAWALKTFHYIHGVLVLKERIGNSRAGKAMIKEHRGYFTATDGKKKVPVHRIVYAMFNGDLEKGVIIDHINRDRTDNRVENLRAITPKGNTENILKADRRNATGLRGVHLKVREGHARYYARISSDGKFIALGGYDTPEEAHQAYIRAKKELHKAFTHHD